MYRSGLTHSARMSETSFQPGPYSGPVGLAGRVFFVSVSTVFIFLGKGYVASTGAVVSLSQ